MKNYLLDTNVVSEWVKPRPNSNVIRWLADIDEDTVYLSVVTFAEVAHGVAEMPPGRRRDALKSWLEKDLYLRFERRILLVDFPVASAWGKLMALRRRSGVTLNPMDAFFAATAGVHSLTLVTRNTKHFDKAGISTFDPWLPS
ncbi:MAG TPA: type II toxin-antitoxin system VapC family toxin [Candidatus Acidoferrales bacterium]